MTMRNALRYLVVAALVPSLVHAADAYVIAHAALKLTPEIVRDVYVGDKQFSGDVKLVLLDNATSQADFRARVLKLDASKYDNLWTRKAFRDALNPPVVKSSDREIIDFVKKTPGAVGHIGSKPPEGVLLVQKF